MKVSVTSYIEQYVLLSRIHEFWHSYPTVQVSLTPSLEAVDIAALGFDLAVRAKVAAPDWAGLNAELLCRTQLIVVAAPDLIGADLPRMPWIFTRGRDRTIR